MHLAICPFFSDCLTTECCSTLARAGDATFGLKLGCWLSDGKPTLSPNVPQHPATAHRRGELLSQPLLDHGPRRYEKEAPVVIEHRITSVGKHDVALLDAGHALAVCHGPMLQAGCRSVNRSIYRAGNRSALLTVEMTVQTHDEHSQVL
jgi:hypothetical protein